MDGLRHVGGVNVVVIGNVEVVFFNARQVRQ